MAFHVKILDLSAASARVTVVARRTCQFPETAEAALALRAAQACQPIFEDAGLKIDECVACGWQGCVFTLNKNRVAKVTPNESEAQFAAYLMQRRNLPKSLPKIYGVWSLPADCEYAYVIVREDIPDMPKLGNRTAFNTVMKYMIGDAHDMVENEDTDLYAFEELIYNERDRLAEVDLPVFDQLVDLYRWMIPKGIWIGDVHADNIGMRRDGSVAVRDFGFNVIPDSNNLDLKQLG